MKKIALIALTMIFCNQSFGANSNDLESKTNYYVRSKGYSSNPESDPPSYVYQLNETGIENFKDFNWVDFGINYRMRTERRDNDFRRNENTLDTAFLSRTQVYFGIKNILDPFRFAVELQDSRVHNSKFPEHTRDENKLDFFQLYGELYFKNHEFIDRPISLRVGRMAFEVLDRKLLARDDWGNTGTNFQGLRAIIGEKENDWQLDTFALQPIVKNMEDNDKANDNQWLYAAIINWRRWSSVATFQPFYFRFDQNSIFPAGRSKIHSPGMRVYGDIGQTNFDFDLVGIYQFGESQAQYHRAYAYSSELGYTFNQSWKPRISGVYGYASGDKNSNDNKNQRFERFYGFNRPWSNSNTIEWENIEALKSRIEFKPYEKVRMEGSYSYYWLASKTDSWERANLRDTNGISGRQIGRDLDFRTHYMLNKYVRTTLGFAHFIPGKFAKAFGRGDISDFIYLEITLNPFGNKPN